MHDPLKRLPDLDNNDFKPLYAQLTDAILDYIHKEALKPGDPIPSEKDFINRYGVSRMTVRLAIQRLATQGMIKKIQGKGTFVAKKRLASYVQAGPSLEEYITGTEGQIENELVEALLFKNPLQLYLDELGLPAGSSVFKIKRLKRIATVPVGIEIKYLPMTLASQFKIDEFNNGSLNEMLNAKPETAIHRITFRVRAETLSDFYTEPLGVPEGSQGLIQMETVYSQSDEPLMTGKTVLAADRIELRYESRRQKEAAASAAETKRPYLVVSKKA